jgi:hypothetical protein
MRPMPIVAVQPDWQLGAALFGGVERGSVSPFAQGGLDEALGFAIGLRRIGSGADVFDAEPAAGVLEGA